MSVMCLKRLKKERQRLEKGDLKHLFLCVPESEEEFLTWHYVLFGQKDTDFEGGIYHGIILFPTEYPYKPPSFKMFTPNGRFEVNKKLCMSNTSYHQESWSPFWTLSTLLNGLLSFMNEDSHGIGSIQTSKATRKKLAKESMSNNLKNDLFVQLFPQLCQQYMDQLLQQRKQKQQRSSEFLNSSESGNGSLSGNNHNSSNQNDSTKNGKMNEVTQSLQNQIQNLAINQSWKTESLLDWIIIAIVILGIGFALTLIL